jgi:hypothetical protein
VHGAPSVACGGHDGCFAEASPMGSGASTKPTATSSSNVASVGGDDASGNDSIPPQPSRRRRHADLIAPGEWPLRRKAVNVYVVDMNVDRIWLPVAALVGVTAVVWVKLYVDRLGEMRRNKIDAQSLASARAAGQLEKTSAAENFRNLFEVPVLFYLLCVAIAVNGGSTPGFVAAAWTYVGLRALHSVIHVTYNRVVHRFLVYVASTLLLFAMWIAWVVGLR